MKVFENTVEWLEEANPPMVEIKDIKKWIIEELEEFEEALANKDEQEMYDAIADASIFLGNIPYFYKLDIDKLKVVSEAVNLSNWTKFCATEQEAIDTVEAYANGTHPNKLGEKIKTYYTQGKNSWVVKKLSDNKIMKSINFKDTNQFL